MCIRDSPYMHTRMHHNHMLEHRQVQTFPCPPPEPDIGSGSSCLTGHRDQYFMRFRRVMKLCKRLGGWVSGTDATSNHGRHGAACSNISKPTPRGKPRASHRALWHPRCRRTLRQTWASRLDTIKGGAGRDGLEWSIFMLVGHKDMGSQ